VVCSSVSAQLRQLGSDAWQAATNHPMVREIAAGVLPHRAFRRYFEQNIVYLEDYARAVAMATSKAPDRDALAALAAMIDRIVRVELPANRGFLERLGGPPPTVQLAVGMEPTTYAYTRHLLSTCAYGDCATGLAALLPCQWSYGEIGASIRGRKPSDPIYADWVSLFGDDSYAALVDATTSLLDRLAGSGDVELKHLWAVFDRSTRYEVEFWDMAYSSSTTPVHRPDNPSGAPIEERLAK
jgi:thiaminase/transcriptional activator TenA